MSVSSVVFRWSDFHIFVLNQQRCDRAILSKRICFKFPTRTIEPKRFVVVDVVVVLFVCF